MKIKETQDVTHDGEQLQELSNYIINGWLSTTAEVKQEIHPY